MVKYFKIILTLLGLARFFSAKSTLVSTKIVLFPCGSIWLTKSVTMLRSASTLPSGGRNENFRNLANKLVESDHREWKIFCSPWMHRMMALGFCMYALLMLKMVSFVSDAMPAVTVWGGGGNSLISWKFFREEMLTQKNHHPSNFVLNTHADDTW